MSLYNLRTIPSGWQMTKFDDSFNVEASYQVDETTCTCPAGPKPTCRHRQMFVEFFCTDHVDDGWFLEYNPEGQHTWHKPIQAEGAEQPSPEPEPEGTESPPMPTTPVGIPLSVPGHVKRRV